MGFLSCSGTLLFQCACRSQQMPGRLASKFYRARLVVPRPHLAVFAGAQAMFALVGVGFACRQEPFRLQAKSDLAFALSAGQPRY